MIDIADKAGLEKLEQQRIDWDKIDRRKRLLNITYTMLGWQKEEEMYKLTSKYEKKYGTSYDFNKRP